MRDCCDFCGDISEQRFRKLLNTERCVCLILGALIGASVAGLIVTSVYFNYFK